MARLFEIEHTVRVYSRHFDEGAETLRELLQSVTRCLDRLLPLEVSRRIDREGSTLRRADDGRLSVVRHPALEAARLELARLDLFRIFLPEDVGGLGLPLALYHLAVQLIARYDASLALVFLVHGNASYTIDRYGSEAQRQRYLPSLARGEQLATVAFTESQAGSDAGAIRTRATLEGDRYRLEGSKSWITHGGDADLLVTTARTGPLELAIDGVTAFLLEREADGVEVLGLEEKTGLSGSPTAAIAYNGIAIPAERRLGAAGEGGRVMFAGIGMTRVSIAAQALGIGKRAFQAAVDFSLDRVQGGSAIVEHEAVRHRLAEIALALSAIEGLICREAQLEARGEWHVREMSIAKYYASEILQQITTRAIGLHGGYGCSRAYEVERCRREAVVLPLFGGTSEIQWFIIARELGLAARGLARADYRARDLAQLSELEARAHASGGMLPGLVARTGAACDRLWQLAERISTLGDAERTPHERPLAELATALAVALSLLLQASAPDAEELDRELAAVAVDGLEAQLAPAGLAPRRALTRALRARL
jgi:alkylation response protein AidB-like acyl-CoA dehydrogenase